MLLISQKPKSRNVDRHQAVGRSDQQTADPTVAILEWVQQLELPVHHGDLDQRVQVVASEITFEGFEMIEQLQRRRRHERRLIDRAALGSEPVLFHPELARRLVRPPARCP